MWTIPKRSMRTIAVAGLVVVAGCLSTASDTRWRDVELKRPDGTIVHTTEPPPEILNSAASLELKNLAVAGKDILSGKIDIQNTFTRVRQENPRLDALRVLMYHVDQHYASGAWTPEEYGQIHRDIINKYTATL